MRSVSGTTSTSSRGNAKARGSRQNRSCVRFTVEGLDLSSHTIRKVKFLSKNSILTNPQHFHEFFTQIFFDNFSREIKVVNSSKVQNHNTFTSFSSRITNNFFGKSELNFWTKNEDFEYCVKLGSIKNWTLD